MTANVNPIFTLTPDVQTDGATGMAPTILTATGDYTGVSANHAQVFKAGVNGSYVERLRFKAIGTNAATVARIYLNNGSTHVTATNNSFYGEISLPAVTAINTSATADVDYPMGFVLPAGFTIWAGLAATVAAGWVVTSVGGDY